VSTQDPQHNPEGSSVLNSDAPDDARPSSPDDTRAPDWEDEEIGERLRHASDEELDNAPFGIIRVDDGGVVQFFNQYESKLSGVDPEEAIGRNFFTQVAPCTNNRLFRGRFEEGVRQDDLDTTFTYTYTYRMRPTLVDVHLYRDSAGHNWIVVRER